VILVALLAGASVALLLARPPVDRRLQVLLPSPAPQPGPASPTRRRLLCVLAGAVAWWVVGGHPGLGVGLVVAAGGPEALTRLEQRNGREEQELVQQLPLALDLLAACLAGGGSLADALRSVSRALQGPCGARLGRVAASLDVGTPPEHAFLELGTTGAAGSAARALCRASDAGIPVAGAVARVAEDARRKARAAARRRARRAGVLASAPLTTCFLPAFLLLGIVPCVVGVVAPLVRAL
jgi:Flp pilus assembly protein TadB